MSAASHRAATEFAAVRKFRFGTSAESDDGELGSVVAVVVEPESRTATHVGVRFGLFGGTRFVPIAALTDANAAGVTLGLARAEIEKLSAAPAGATLTGKTQVAMGERRLGHLTQLTINRETLALRHLVVERGLGGEVLVAAPDIASLDGRRIQLDPTRAGAQPLMPFRPDSELYAEVRAAIESYARLRVDVPGIQIHAIDGVVWLKGHVSSDLNRRLIADQLTNIRGLAELHNELIGDADLAAAIGAALGADPRTATERIGVYPALGNVHLRGYVDSAAAKETAGAIAAGVPGVASVANELSINSLRTVLPMLAAVTNEEDIVPGGN